ncbi:hypothetical protein FOCC_FOCC011160 [Frankliniella occidentalis]|nr:hypothetical protein FOCC_FOCC011160 [Frankliniella occidentalis]
MRYRYRYLRALCARMVGVWPGCGPKPQECKTCSSAEVDCFVLDNHGFVIVAEDLAQTGRFFGEVQGAIMEMMVREGIYRRVTIYDYQAVCFRPDGVISSGPKRAITVSTLIHES